MKPSYGDGKPSRRIGLQIATVPMSSGLRVGRGREIGPRYRCPEIARKCEAAVRQEGPLGKPGGLFLCGDQGEDLGRCGVGRAGIERRRRIVFEPELDRFRGLAIDEFGHQRQREIDAGGDAAAGEAVAVDA
ncbi:hypothetical protein chiPu_0030061, partial [Chiloscyllium punctatum]|nr:hypothetical protein [Chiloscyllium punctatum]